MKTGLIAIFTLITLATFAQTPDTTRNNPYPQAYTFATLWKAIRAAGVEKGARIVISDKTDPRGGPGEIVDTTEGFHPDGAIIISIPGTKFAFARDLSQTDGIYAKWFGVTSDTTVSSSAAAQAAINYAWSKRKNNTLGLIGQIWSDMPPVIFPSRFAIASTVYVPAGLTLVFNNTRIKAIASMDRMFRTYVQGTDYTTEAFANRDITIKGRVVFDGNNMVSGGWWSNLVTKFDNDAITVVKCTVPKWGATEYKIDSTVNANNIYTQGDLTKAALGDEVAIWDSTSQRYLNGLNYVSLVNPSLHKMIVASSFVDTLVPGHLYYVRSLATGFHSFGNQNRVGRITTNYNTLGAMFAASVGSIGTSDDNVQDEVFAENNDFGVAYVKCSDITIRKATIQHNKYVNLTTTRVENLNFWQLYSEVDPIFAGINNEKYALNYISGRGITINSYTPVDPAVGWYRPYLLDGTLNLIISGGDLASVLQNPDSINHPNDFALVKIAGMSYTSSVNVKLGAYKNLSRLDTAVGVVIDASYNKMPANANLEAVGWNSGTPFKVGTQRFYGNIESYQKGSTKQPKFKFDTDLGRFYMNGDSTTDTYLRRDDSGIVATTGILRTYDAISIQNSSGFFNNLFPDRNGFIRTTTTRLKDPNRKDKDSVGIAINQGKYERSTDSSTITINNADGMNTFYEWVLTSNMTVPNPAVNQTKQRLSFRFKQDATGGRTLTWGNKYSFPAGYDKPTLNPSPNTYTTVDFIYNPSVSLWESVTRTLSDSTKYIQNQNAVKQNGNFWVKTGKADTLTTTTVSLTDSSQIAPTTAWVKQQGYTTTAAGSSTIKPYDVFINLAAATIAASTTSYASPGTGSFGTTDASRSAIIPASGGAGTISNLTVLTSGTQSATGAITFTVMKATDATGTTFNATSVVTTVTAGGSGKFNSSATSIHINAGDVYTIQAVNAATATSTGIRAVSYTFTPD